MNKHKSPYLLKVFSGPNKGAKIHLQTGSHTIGNTNDCEIIFHDQHIAPKHIKLVVTDNDVFIHPLASPVFVAGKDIARHDVKLRPYQVVTFGNTNFAIGSATNKWPKIKRPKLQHPAKKKQKTPKKSPSPPSFLKYIFVGLAILAIANIFYFKPDFSNLLSSVGAKKTIEAQTQETIKDLGFSGLNVENLKNNEVRITGYVRNKQEKQRLLNKVANLDKTVAYRVWVADELVEHANYISTSYGESDIHFSMEKYGELAAKGYVKNASNWNNARLAILSDIDGIKNIQDINVDSLPQQLEKFRTYISKEAFSKRVSLAIKKGKITVSGELTDTEISRWKKIRNQFFTKYGEIPDLVENLQSPRSQFKLAIRGVSVGKVPFITSKDDKKYLLGSHLGEGYYVKSITSDRILLRHNDIEIPVYFGKRDKDNATDEQQSAK